VEETQTSTPTIAIAQLPSDSPSMRGILANVG